MHKISTTGHATPIKKIVAIGGGDIRLGGTLKIDQEIIKLSGKTHPKALFIPTASSDHEGYWKHFDKYYGKKLGCKTDVLFLLKDLPTTPKPPLTHQQISTKILSSDIIYVGGGNTLKMMRLWRKLKIDKLLKKAWEKGIVLSGLSAGSICWFDSGHSDSMSFYNPKKWDYINVKSLGFIKGIHCPHYDSATLKIPRKKDFQNMIKKISARKGAKNTTGIAIDNNCAIAFTGDKIQVLKSKPHAKAYRVYKKNGKIISEPI